MYRAAPPEEKGAERPPATRPPAEENSTTEITARTIDQIRKWGCHFEGKDPIAFLERVEELKSAYGIAGQQLLNGLPELLRGNAFFFFIMVPKYPRTVAYVGGVLHGFPGLLSPTAIPRQISPGTTKPTPSRRRTIPEVCYGLVNDDATGRGVFR